MAKSKVLTPGVTAPTKRTRTTSEIDDIFSSKPSTSVLPPPSEVQPKKKKVKKAKVELVEEIVESGKGKGKVIEPLEARVKVTKAVKKVEEVIDPSTIIDNFKNAPPVLPTKAKGSGKGDDKIADAEDRFMDSRGTSRRKMDDGMPIYDISELKIGLGGDTDECPFDCQCCF